MNPGPRQNYEELRGGSFPVPLKLVRRCRPSNQKAVPNNVEIAPMIQLESAITRLLESFGCGPFTQPIRYWDSRALKILEAVAAVSRSFLKCVVARSAMRLGPRPDLRAHKARSR
jgi:hypothetical protein